MWLNALSIHCAKNQDKDNSSSSVIIHSSEWTCTARSVVTFLNHVFRPSVRLNPWCYQTIMQHKISFKLEFSKHIRPDILPTTSGKINILKNLLHRVNRDGILISTRADVTITGDKIIVSDDLTCLLLVYWTNWSSTWNITAITWDYTSKKFWSHNSGKT